ncbi:hypothetical protein A6A04_08315 [Paramagnetospirillum marisnigri]|uniref:MobA-like NTP transferase domain-containing protein n=2 Tax=Paramagnetospirillum marisnigri TaxID=1285242 RepID=A0A178M7Y1_9PROT|nr:hypothetical protein A6A04_08315 [Paramagnetospirillum marisnigri]
MGRDKCLITVDGLPMVGHALRAALDGGLDPVVLVRGAEPLPGLSDRLIQVVNAAPERGMGSSLALGVAALPDDAVAVVVLLADMPRVTAAHVERLAAAFDPGRGVEVVVPVCGGRRGNPVLLGRRLFAGMSALTGDRGAKGLIEGHAALVAELEMDAAVLQDVDSPEDLQAMGEQS